MLTKRDCILGGLATTLTTGLGVARAANLSFEALLKSADAQSLFSDRNNSEGAQFQLEKHRGPAPRKNHSDRPISQDAFDLFIACEVSSKAHYVKALQVPTLPPDPSGITIGIGYDVGWVQTAWLDQEWQELDGKARDRLKVACGHHGAAAQTYVSKLKDIQIPWELALAQFKKVLLPLYAGETVAGLPNTEKLKPDCFGALVDLVYNRGAAFKKPGDRYLEMREIHDAMVEEDFESIPNLLIKMARIWDGSYPKQKYVKGLVLRRKYEAALFKQGLEKGGAG